MLLGVTITRFTSLSIRDASAIRGEDRIYTQARSPPISTQCLPRCQSNSKRPIELPPKRVRKLACCTAITPGLSTSRDSHEIA